LETKQLLSARPYLARAAESRARSLELASQAADTAVASSSQAVAAASAVVGPKPAVPLPPISLDRVTNPHGRNALFDPPFGHVLVQNAQPIPGKVYNILFLSVYNATNRTFTASDGIAVRVSSSHANWFPILTGNEVWAPGGRIVFYVLTNKYYPLTPTQSTGFQINFSSPKATGIPGPSGIALRVKYDPATFLNTLDGLVTSGPGSYGHQFGLPDTAIWQILPRSSKVVYL
jgi:hypothetical protein